MSTPTQVLEVAILDVRSAACDEFEAAFRTASKIISSMPGYLSHELRRCVEVPNRYILLVQWRSLEDHTVGFRKSPEYQHWRALLHHFYDPFPTVEHYGPALVVDRANDAIKFHPRSGPG
jgi:heme-degrading monooxygenase HmoA